MVVKGYNAWMVKLVKGPHLMNKIGLRLGVAVPEELDRNLSAE
jgi:hypothetical protein